MSSYYSSKCRKHHKPHIYWHPLSHSWSMIGAQHKLGNTGQKAWNIFELNRAAKEYIRAENTKLWST